ncbi:S9 family peptidase [Erythrobacter sp. THAF29]|uniref:alpha/beta hydrolase family protein n=1 Tax=Erythrobacter sp. THAF29 TaxID=2587851 RepID=UPI0012678AC5|nr:prolyl oligopeptidase family serine peptidase [Erythrobacter sp. THAF29]QFT77006.1 Prolyl tripeptidyl peptidase precursor [Erythrobacter sp. THAF29]
MKLFKAPLMAAMVGVSAIGLSVAAPSDTQAQASVPIDVWALRDVVNAVQVSPDGQHVLVHKVESREGEYLLEIYNTNDLSKPVRRLNADPMEIISAQWVSDNFIFGTAWQINREQVKRPEQDIRDYLAFSYDLEKNKFSKSDGEFQLISTLPNEPDKILIGGGNAIPDPTGVDPFAAFRPRAYYKFNLKTGGKELVLKGNSKFPVVQRWDSDGNPRYTSTLDRSDGKLKEYYRKPGDSSWTLFQETDLEDQGNLYRVLGGFHGIAGFSAEDPNIGYLIDNRNGEDKAALYEFDFRTGQVGEKLVAVDNADIMGIRTHSIPGNDKLVAARYPGAKWEYAWFDADEKALYDALEQQIPYAHQVSITSRSTDGKTMIVSNRGPRDPGSFWLVKDGQLAKLGSRNPLVNPEQLSDVKFIRYPARDGKMIPAYVTVPKGEGPFPLIVMPHGGPHVPEVVSYDEWGQVLANAGYMVLQPGYRMTVGWGQDHFDSAYGEHGGAMQDDKDDGALYLVEQGLVDPDRIAMFGWSYGGYAALVALSRENNIYQCAIAGAAVADAEKQYLGRRDGDLKALDEWSKRRGTIGINPINEVAKVNIPLLMVHPEDDRRVMYYHFKDYKKAFEAAGKQGQFVTLEDADHFYTTLMYNHQQQFYTKMLDFLANDCGPGGL